MRYDGFARRKFKPNNFYYNSTLEIFQGKTLRFSARTANVRR
jgi:hypothetical protein